MNILLLLIGLPTIGSLFILGSNVSLPKAKIIGLNVSLITFLLSLSLWVFFDKAYPYYQFVALDGYLGIDGISIFFIILTTFLIPLCLLIGWNLEKLPKEYIIAFLILESCLIAVFSVLDLLIFYIFFESVLIPMFLIIGIWGSRERKIQAAYQFFLYTLLGSILMLIGILIIYFEIGTTNIEILTELLPKERSSKQIFLWLTFFASFAIKIPMIPFHIWLPEAHVEAPTGGSVILAGLLLKLGTYGFLRFSIPMFPYASIYFTPLIYTLSVIGIIYTSLTTLRQIDLKKIIAYSSIGHMNYVTLGLFSFNIQGLHGGLLLMLSHGIVSSALFLCIGMLYERTHTRLLKYYGGITQRMPLFAIIFLFFILANISVPGTSSFVGEFLILTSVGASNFIIAGLAALSVILGAAYSIWLYNRVCFGPSSKFLPIDPVLLPDLSRREVFILIPLVFTTLYMGVSPNNFIDVIHYSLAKIVGGSL